MKEGKGKLKHFKNQMKEKNLFNEMCWQNMPQWSIIYIDAFHVYDLG